MKKSFFVTGCIVLAALVSCSSPTSSSSTTGTASATSYTNQVLPTTLSVKTPKSLGTGSTSSTTSGFVKLRSASTAATGSQQSAGYVEVTSMTSMMQEMLPMSVMFGVIADAVISQNKLTAGDHPNQSVTLTQAMYNTVAAQLPAGEASSLQSNVGQSMTLTDVNYATGGSGTLQNSVSITAQGQTVTYKWSNDRKSLQMSMSMTSSGTTMTMIVTYAGSDGSGAFKVSAGTGNTFQMSLAPSATSTSDGASTSLTITTSSGTFAIYGYADDNGGIVNTTITPTTGSATNWEEGFDGSGTLVFQASGVTDVYSTSGAAITEAACKSSYGTAATAASTLICGATALLNS